MRLEGKTALITGAAAGIGRATMERFLQEGATVMANDINPEGEEIVRMWKERGYPAEFYLQDVAEIERLPLMVDYTIERFGKLDILINNAGTEFPRTIFDMTQFDWEKLHKINLESVFFLSQAAACAMKRRQYGRIVNVSSIQGFRGASGSSHYNATKGGIIQLTRCFAVELADYGIMVNSVAPGVIHTAMSLSGGVDETETDEFLDIYIKHGKIPLRRPGAAEEVASSILFLASDDCQYMTGQVLNVDGGLSVVW